MKPVDTILTHGTVVTMDPSYTVIENGAVAIQGDSIAAVGTTDDVTQAFKPVEVVDCTGLIVIPGLVNAHTHVPMTLLRGLADDALCRTEEGRRPDARRPVLRHGGILEGAH